MSTPEERIAGRMKGARKRLGISQEETAHRLGNRAAEETGVSSAQFVREAAMMRAILTLRDDDLELQALAERVQHLARRDD
jgi:transcriptional regulator with XRE-family HTH domain